MCCAAYLRTAAWIEMHTQRFKTYSEPARVTDRDAVQALITEYRFPIDVEVFFVPKTDCLRVDCGGSFLEAYTTDTEHPVTDGLDVPHTPALDEFFTRLAEFIVPGDALVIQLVGIGETDEPLIGIEWRVTNGDVQETAFTCGDSTDWTDLSSNQTS